MAVECLPQDCVVFIAVAKTLQCSFQSVTCFRLTRNFLTEITKNVQCFGSEITKLS